MMTGATHVAWLHCGWHKFAGNCCPSDSWFAMHDSIRDDAACNSATRTTQHQSQTIHVKTYLGSLTPLAIEGNFPSRSGEFDLPIHSESARTSRGALVGIVL